MRSVTVRLDDLRTTILCLGYVGENEHTRINIDAKKMYDQYPSASASLTVCPPSGASYPAVIERDGDMVIWDITDSDLTAEGSGEIQLSFTAGEVVAKTYIGRFRVSRSIIPTGAIPEPLDDFLTRAGAALTAIPETIDESLGQITAEAETLAAGSSATAEYNNGTKKFSFGIPKGDKGDTGHSPVVTAQKAGKVTTVFVDGTSIAEINDGDDGHSPVVTASKSDKVTTVYVDGTAIATINDGEDGDDGYSPTATVSKVGKVATISITDKNGTTTATVSDGEDADPSTIIDDNAGSGDTDKVWSADKSADTASSLLNDLSSKADVIVATESGSIVTLTDAVADEPLTDCVVTIDEDQTGFAGCNISRTGRNLFDKNAITGSSYLDTTTGAIAPAVGYCVSDFIPVFANVSVFIPASNTARRWFYDTNKTAKAYLSNSGNQTFTPTENGYIRVSIHTVIDIDTYQIEFGSSSSDYTPYSGNTYFVTFPVTVTDGGSFDSATGVLTVNTDPVTTYQLDPVTIKTLSNPNNIWADTGDVTVSYKCDTKAYVDQNEGVKDVQVNGTSVVDANGVANVPVADSSNPGVVKVSQGTYGLTINNGELYTSPAQDYHIKEGTNTYRPITSSRQHLAAFYGLAKAANADMASVSGATVGVYPEAQKVAIRKMLGVYREWELIADVTIDADSAQFEVTTDTNGQEFELSEMYVRASMPAPTTGNNDYVSAAILVKKEDSTNATVSAPTFRYSSGTANLSPVYRSEIILGIVETTGRGGASFSTTNTVSGISSASDKNYKSIRGFRLSQYSANQTLIPSDTNIKIYGIRK